MITLFYRRVARMLPGLGLISFVLLLAACSDATTTTNATPTPSVTAKIATSTAIATQSPTATKAPSTPLWLYISCGDVKANGYGVDVEHGKVCAFTRPGARLTIKVTYCNGQPDPSSVLQKPELANEHGYYRWLWTPQPDCKGQPIWSYNATVTASLNGQTISESVSAMA